MIYKIRSKDVEINKKTQIFYNGKVYWVYINNIYTPLTKKVVDNLILEFYKDVTGAFGSKFQQLKVVGFKG